MRRHQVLAGVVATVLVAGLGAGTALAVSDGNYDPEQQHCSGSADSADHPDRTEEGCQTATVHAGDGTGHEYGGVGVQQQPDGSFPGPDDVLAWGPDGAAYDPASGTSVYFGADDNLDEGEHDSSDQISNGPSDGGAIQLNVTPASMAAWVAALQAGDQAYLLTHPLPLVDFGTGACADGICAAVTTQRRVAFQGDGKGERDVSDYEGKEWDPESCGGPDDTKEDCGGHKLDHWAKQEGTTYVEPGVQVYEDPDPQGSPLGPYPLPAAYAGTCGVIVGGGPVQAPAPLATNDAGQVAVKTGCTD